MKLKTKFALYSILGTALLLVITVLVLYFFLSGGLRKIEAGNISEGLDALKRQLEEDGENIAQKVTSACHGDDYQILQIVLTRDRQGQIDQSRLIDLVSQYQSLLKLDFLEVISRDSMLLASGLRPTDFNRKSEHDFIAEIIEEGFVQGFTPYRVGENIYPAYLSGRSLTYEDSAVAIVIGGIFVDDYYLSRIRLPYNMETAVFSDRSLYSSTLPDHLQALLEKRVRSRPADDISSEYNLDQVSYQPFLQNLYSLVKDQNFYIMLLHPPSLAKQLASQSIKIYLIVALAAIMLAGLVSYAFAQRLSAPLTELSLATEQIAEGRFDQKIFWFSSDELGRLVTSFNTMYERLKRSQNKLIQAEKLAAWNQMARKIAHEIKNPLTPIKVSIEDLKRSYRRSPDQYGDILDDASKTILTEIDKLKRIVDEFSAFAKLPQPELKPIEPTRLVEESLKLYRAELEAGRIMIESEDIEGKVMADRGLFSQALVNVVKNALESDPEGKITVEISPDNDQAKISVIDHGQGISTENLGRVFTPYFTTKSEGSGLGLVIAQRIVFDHDGEISVYSSVGEETVFTIKLPVVTS